MPPPPGLLGLGYFLGMRQGEESSLCGSQVEPEQEVLLERSWLPVKQLAVWGYVHGGACVYTWGVLGTGRKWALSDHWGYVHRSA